MFRIRKLDIFIIKQFGLLFFGTFFICQFVLMMQFLWRYVDELIGKGLSLEVMAQFFTYMGLMLMPQAFPLAILLSSLITFGNLGESSELTAIKAAGISLMQTFRPLVAIVLLISCISYYFQDVIGPKANLSFYQLLLSVKHKSPELEIPEGIFYDGLPGSNIYVQKKNMDTGMLYGIMIYRQTGSYEDQAIILADSGMMQSTEEKKHLVLTLYSGEWFENMRSQDLANSANIPYRRETFSTKRIVLDFDSGLNMTDMADVAGDARMKPLRKLLHDIDSIKEHNDSVGYSFYIEAKRYGLRLPSVNAEDSVKIMKEMANGKANFDSIYERQSPIDRQSAVKSALASVQSVKIQILLPPSVGGHQKVHPIALVSDLLLHRCSPGSHHPQGWSRRARHRVGAGIHHLLHLRQHRVQDGPRRPMDRRLRDDHLDMGPRPHRRLLHL